VRVFGDESRRKHWERVGDSVREATIKAFWCARRRTFISNLPWESEEGETRMDDLVRWPRRSSTISARTATTAASISSAGDCPPEMGFSYPANAGWRHQALAEGRPAGCHRE
jgi:hypothetical protein